MILNNTIHLDFLGDVNLLLGITIQIFCAIFIGFIIGFNRELNNKAAELRQIL